METRTENLFVKGFPITVKMALERAAFERKQAGERKVSAKQVLIEVLQEWAARQPNPRLAGPGMCPECNYGDYAHAYGCSQYADQDAAEGSAHRG